MSFRGFLLKAGIDAAGGLVSIREGLGINAYDAQVLKTGRIATGSANGSAISIDATNFQWSEANELRYTVADWADTYTLTEFKGLYLRVQNEEANASGSIFGMDVLGVANAVNTQYVWGGRFYAYLKGSAGITVSRAYGIQAEFSMDAGGSADTISGEAAPILAKVTGGTLADYTKVHGIIVRFGDMNGGSVKYGNGILIEDDADMSGATTLTNGISITAGATNGINISGSVAKAIRMGSYGSRLVAVSGATTEVCTIGLGGAEDDFYIGYGSYIRTTGEDGKGFGASFLVEATNTTGTPTLQGLQSMAFLGSVGGSEAAILKTRGGDLTAGMFAAWFKIGCNTNCQLASGSLAAAIWLDSQLHGSGNLNGTVYMMFISTDNVTDAVMGFAGTGGHTNFLSFDSDAVAKAPVASATISGGTQDKYLTVDLNGTPYGIALYAI
jgi:hypothetical protein